MLALYHLFSNATPGEHVGIDEVLKEAGISRPQKVNRVVLVGNKISPGNPVTKADGRWFVHFGVSWLGNWDSLPGG